ncbi:30S ribosomal protein S3, partial [Methanococcoides sp. SA1]|nr:30S ribosomal protein S3 [Methanococcoides sp. SA1]
KKLGTLGCKVRIIHPDAVLPDSYRLKTAEELGALVPAPVEEEKSAGIEELVEAEAKGEVAEAEKTVVEEAAKAEAETVEETVEDAAVSEVEADVVTGESVTEEGEERREVNGVWQHKHGAHDYWHPTGRMHRES